MVQVQVPSQLRLGNLDVSVARATLASFVVVCPASLGLAPEVSRVFFPTPRQGSPLPPRGSYDYRPR